MMKPGLLALAIISITQLCAAATCTNGTLASYASLGAGGCTIGMNQLYDFQILAPLFGPDYPAIDPSEISIRPLTATTNPGIQAATRIDTTTRLEATFTYRISGNTYTSTNLTQSQTGVGGYPRADGVVNFAYDYCAGGTFGPDGISNCTGTHGNNSTLVTADAHSPQTFTDSLGSVTLLSVTDNIVFDPGFGYSAGGVFTNQFAAPNAVPAPTPEPLSAALTAMGLLLAAALKLRSTARG